MNTNLERCPQHAWHLEQEIQDEKLDTKILNDIEFWITKENHRVEALWIALRGWWNNERTQQRIHQIKQILSELNYEKYGHERK
jgi:hypothetical protein